MRILVVEDDTALGLFLTRGLKLEGHEAELVTNGTEGMERAIALRPDLMVLDLGLPQKDGMQVLEEMRDHFKETSVLVLTGRNSLEDRVKCLNMGADDCLLKPFSFNELMARCKALMRRREQFADPMLRVGVVALNRMDRSVLRDGNRVDLTAKEFALLEYLMLARGRVCLRSELLRDVWQGSSSAGTNVVDVYVNYLRKKLGAARTTGDLRTADRVIETVRGEGYTISEESQAAPDLFTALLQAEPAWSGGGRQVHNLQTETTNDLAWLRTALHDISQPLTALECGLYIGTMSPDGVRAPHAEELLQTILAGLEQCERVIKGLRDIQERLDAMERSR